MFLFKRILILFFLLFFAFQNFTLAEETIPLYIEAQSLIFESQKKQILAQGMVGISLKKWQLRADKATLETDAQKISLEGNILIKHKNYRLQARQAVFDLKGGGLTFDGFRTVFSDPQIKGKIVVKAKTLTLKESEEFRGNSGIITTCDLKTPHYYMDAQEFEYYPEDKIIARKLNLWVGGQKVLSRPFQIINLKKRRQQSLFPLIGQNQVEGWFLKNTFDYFWDSLNSGSVYLNFFQKKGLGVGFEHFYDEPGKNFSFYLYHIDERDTAISDWASRLSFDYQFSPALNFSFSHDYYDIYLLPAGRRESVNSRFILGGGDQLYKYNLKIENKENRLGTAFQNFSTIFDYTQNFSEKLTGYILTDYRKSQRAGSPADLELEIKNLSLTYNFALGSLELSFKKRFDLDYDTFHGDDTFPYFEKLPEINFSSKSVDLQIANLNGYFSIGRYLEYSQPPYLRYFDFTHSNKYLAGLNFSKEWPVFKNSQFFYQFGFSQYFYSTGDARYGVVQRVGLENKIGDVLKHTITHTHNYYLGGNPFTLVDHFSDFNLIRTALILDNQPNQWYFDLSAGYNFLSRYYDDVLTKLEWALSSFWQTSLATGFNLNRYVYRDLIWKNRLKFDDYNFELDGGLRYDLNSGRIRAGELLFDWTFGDTWERRVRFLVDYVFQREVDSFSFRGLKIIKDLHCFELVFAYQAVEHQFLLSLNIKAFPGEQIDIGAGKEGLFLKGLESG